MRSRIPGVLAFNDPYHDSSFCLYTSDEITHVEVERVTRAKYDSENPLIVFCNDYIDRLGDFNDIAIEEGDYLAPVIRQIITTKTVPQDPAGLLKLINHAPGVRPDPPRARKEPNIRGIHQLFRHLIDDATTVHFCGHHEAHAANAFHSSPFQEALVITLDGGGFDFVATGDGAPAREEIYGGVYRYSGARCTLVEQLLDTSFGLAWFRVNMLLGLAWGEEGTVMAMASLGDPSRYLHLFSEPFCWLPNAVRLKPNQARGIDAFLAVMRQHINDDQDRYDFAAALQRATELRVKEYLGKFITPDIANLCVAGGLFLNCQLLGKIREWFPTLKNVYIPPAPYDGGISIGVAQKILHERLGVERTANPGRRAPFAMGRHYSVGTVLGACHDHGLTARPNRLDEVIERIEAGQIVAVFSGAAESGRRALGHRSIIADPRRPEIKTRINRDIKHRQWFRPLAPMVLAEHVADWFDCPPGFASPYMSFAVPVRPERRAIIPAVTHIDGSARIQTVHNELSPTIHTLLSEWYRRTGLPVLINTSFNDQEPIVETPEDALKTFERVPIDALYFADYGLLVARTADRDGVRDDCGAAANAIASRLDQLIGECLGLRTALLSAIETPAPVADRLGTLFTTAQSRADNTVEPYREVGPGIWIGFQSTAAVRLTIEAKSDQVSSPEQFLNTITIAFTGASAYLSVEAPVAWSEVCDADHFQLALSATPSRPVSCHAVLRFYRFDNSFIDLAFAYFSLQNGGHNINKFGEILINDLLGVDPSRTPLLIIFFDTTEDLQVRVDYINIYFG